MNDPAEHTHVVRRFYAAWGEGDLEAASSCFSPGAVWSVPGCSPIAGSHRGWDAIRDDFFARLGSISGETFSAELVDVASGRHYVVAVQHATAARDARRLDITVCQLMRMEEGRIAEVQSHYSDQEALDMFWSD